VVTNRVATGRGDDFAGRGDRILSSSGPDDRVLTRADMSDLLRRIKRPRRTPSAEPAQGSPALETASAPPEASPDMGGSVLAGEDLADHRPTALRRGRLRKRLRFLERERELLLRDLGGLVYEIHRSGTTRDREHHRALVTGKVARLAGLDRELESGLAALGEARGDSVLREPGIGGMCPRCGEIHASDARFCSACGFPLEVAGAVAPPGGAPPAAVGPTLDDAIVASASGPAVVIHASPSVGGAVTAPRGPASPDEPTRIIAPGAPRAGGADETAGPPASDPGTR
jgi:hypothetical protein